MANLIQEIKDFRKNNKNCVSTSHNMNFQDFSDTLNDLRKNFKKINVKIDTTVKFNHEFIVTIERNRNTK
jgi:hypothetical protein